MGAGEGDGSRASAFLSYNSCLIASDRRWSRGGWGEGDGAGAGTARSTATTAARVANAGRDASFTGRIKDPDGEEDSEDEEEDEGAEDELASSGMICRSSLLYFPRLALLRSCLMALRRLRSCQSLSFSRRNSR
jgi:hypothetical protein